MFNDLDSELFGPIGFDVNPGRQVLVACGYDCHCYISTAGLAPSPYTTQGLIEARFPGALDLISATDDTQSGQLNQAVLNNIIQNVTTEINGYLSSIYPMPLMQTGTVAIIQVTGVDTNGGVTSISVVNPGNYLTAPVADQFPAYMRYIDPLANAEFLLWNDWSGWSCQTGTGLELTVTYKQQPFTDENGTLVQANAVSGIPVIKTAGTLYNLYDIVVLIGGTSFVPAKIREAALVLICHSLNLRRLAYGEHNLFDPLAKMWREKLTSIGNGDGEQLDGTYKRSFSIGAVWNQKSVLFGANSL